MQVLRAVIIWIDHLKIFVIRSGSTFSNKKKVMPYFHDDFATTSLRAAAKAQLGRRKTDCSANSLNLNGHLLVKPKSQVNSRSHKLNGECMAYLAIAPTAFHAPSRRVDASRDFSKMQKSNEICPIGSAARDERRFASRR